MIKQICIWWNAVLVARKLRRKMPAVVERRDAQLPALRKQHKPTRHVIAQNRRDMHAALGLEVK